MNIHARFEQLINDGLSASREGRTDAAMALFGEAGALVPASGVPQFLIGSEHASAGNVEAAEAAFANAVLLAPSLAVARYQLGLLQFSSGRAAVALLTWQPLLDLPDADALPHFVRGFAELAQDHFEDALGHFRAGLACAGGNPAIAADISKVIAEVERLLAAQGQPATDAAGAAEDARAGHVLLAGYGKGLH